MWLRPFPQWVAGGSILLMVGVLSTGCVNKEKGEIMLNQEEAVEVAKREFAKHGYLVSDYNISAEVYGADHEQWIVWFDKKGPFPIPGGKHAVLVHKSTGHAVFMPGE
jgi:hypothetical protein